MVPIALTIAGSDPSGGAGIQADLKTFHQFGAYGEAVITLLTVQNTVRVSRVVVMPPALGLEGLSRLQRTASQALSTLYHRPRPDYHHSTNGLAQDRTGAIWAATDAGLF